MARAGGRDRGLFKRSDAWWIRWTCCYGHEHREKAGSKTLARQLYERRKTATRHEAFCLDEARAHQKREENSSFDKVAERYLAWAREHRPRSLSFRQGAINRLSESFGARPLPGITTEAIERHMRRRQAEGVANATVNRERAVLSSLFVQAIKWGLADHNPVPGTDRRKEDNVAPRPLTDDEADRLMSVLPEHYLPFVVFAMNTGLRLGELQTQRWGDIDMASRTLTVTRPKSGKRETIPLNKGAYAVLEKSDRKSDLVFPDMPSSISVIFPRYVRKAGLEGVTFHCLRDTFISRLAETASAATVMALARHRDFRTTQRYLRLDDNHLREAAESVVFAQNDPLTGTKSGPNIAFYK